MMNDNKPDHIRQELRRALIVCLPYLLIVFFLEDIGSLFSAIHSRLGDPLLMLYIFIASLIIIALLIHSAIDIRDRWATDGFRAVLPFLIYIFAMANSFWSPLRISSETLYNKIVHRALRSSPYGHDILKMHANGSMDIRYQGPLWTADREYGRWSARGDTFYLDYDRGPDTAYVKPDTLVLTKGLLIPVGIPADTLALYKDRFFRIMVPLKARR